MTLYAGTSTKISKDEDKGQKAINNNNNKLCTKRQSVQKILFGKEMQKTRQKIKIKTYILRQSQRETKLTTEEEDGDKSIRGIHSHAG